MTTPCAPTSDVDWREYNRLFAEMQQYRQERNLALTAAAMCRQRLSDILAELRANRECLPVFLLNLPTVEQEDAWIDSGEPLIRRITHE